MKIVIRTKNFKLDKNLEEYINKKINSLEIFLEIFKNDYYGDFFGKGKPKAEAWIEIGKDTFHHQKGKFFFAECQIQLPRKSIRVISKSEDLKLAINEIKDELQQELKQYKNKIIDRRKKEEEI